MLKRANMQVKERIYDTDVLWDRFCQADFAAERYELIDGALVEMSPVGGVRAQLADDLTIYIGMYVKQHNLGILAGEAGYHPPEYPNILLAPDVAFISYARAPKPFPEKFVPPMPDLAIEIKSPRESMRKMYKKARLYLEHGTRLVWLVLPVAESVEVCRLSADGRLVCQAMERADTLSGEDVLPGFRLALRRLFA